MYLKGPYLQKTLLLHWTSQRHNQLFALCGKLIPSLSLYLLLVFLLCVLDDCLWWNARLWLHSVLHGSLEDLLDFFLIFVDYEFAATEPVAMLWTRKENSLIKTNHEDHEVKFSHSPGNSAGLSAGIQIYKYTIINLRQLDLRCMKLLTVASVTAVPDLIICICWCWFLEISFYRGPDWYIYFFY